MKVMPFMLSQIGSRQNEVVMSMEELDLDRLSDSVYSFLDDMTEDVSFFRCMRMGKDIAGVYYWSTDIPEEGSGRNGLYVIIGFIISGDFYCRDSFEWFRKCSIGFFQILEETMGISMSDELSNKLFQKLQGDAGKKMGLVQCQCQNLKWESENGFWEGLKAFISFGALGILNRIKRVIWPVWKLHIYLLKPDTDFFDRWTVFMRTAFNIVAKQGYGDISTLTGYTPCSLLLHEHGSFSLEESDKANISVYKDIPYIKRRTSAEDRT